MGGAWEAECDGYDGTKRDARGGGGVGGELECGLEREAGGCNTEALWPFCGRLSQGLSFQFKNCSSNAALGLGSCTENRLWKAALGAGRASYTATRHSHKKNLAPGGDVAEEAQKEENESVQKVVNENQVRFGSHLLLG
jgi:hypothetical protein